MDFGVKFTQIRAQVPDGKAQETKKIKTLF